MKPKDPTGPQAWLLRAKGNLNLAEKGGSLKGVLFEDLCFKAHQAAEKALKAVCLAQGMDILESGGIDIQRMFVMQIFSLNMLCSHVIRASWKRSLELNIGMP